jgi:Tyrosine phosphatase family
MRMRRGRLFRWHGENEAEIADPRRVGLGTVIDTASAPGELAHYGWVARSVYELPLVGSVWPPPRAVDDPRPLELGVVLESQEAIAELLAILTDPGAYPAAIGCSVAPDQTGAAMTLLLSWLGVSDATITMCAACANPLGRTSPLPLLRTLRQEFGSVDGYAEYLGLASALGYLRGAMLVDRAVARSA